MSGFEEFRNSPLRQLHAKSRFGDRDAGHYSGCSLSEPPIARDGSSSLGHGGRAEQYGDTGTPPAKDVMLARDSLGSMYGGSYLGEAGAPDDGDLRATARRFLEFQRGFLRRRWASYYAVWASAAAVYFLIPFILGFTRFNALPPSTQYLTFVALDVVFTIVAVAVSVRIWGLAERTSDVRSAADGRPSLTGRRNLLRFVIVLAVVVGALTVSTRSVFASFLLGDTALLVLALFLLLHLHRAFRPIPVEGWLAAYAFIFAAAFSYASLLLSNYALGHEIAWFAAVVAWLGCAAYSRYGLPDASEDP